MEKRTEGAWLIHHTKKIQEVTIAPDFEDIELAGKCGLFLSSLAASNEESTLSKEKVEAIAKASNIKKIELETIKGVLKESQLIDTSSSGDVSVIGITTSNILIHTSDIFNHTTSDSFQRASLGLANCSSDKPVNGEILREFIGDTYQLANKQADSLFRQAEDIHLIDYEFLGDDKVYFNGNLFKHDSIGKISKVLNSLSSADSEKVSEVDLLLTEQGCITYEKALKILGKDLLDKLQAIAMYDFNEVSNDTHIKVFITKPSSFSKFGNPFEDDALDLAKAFIASLMYGMYVSTNSRGRIQGYAMLRNTLRKLLRGESVGPCTAIGQDYQVLELNRVIQLKPSGFGMYSMCLLKYDIGQLALAVLEHGDLAEYETINTDLRSSNVSNYSGPEKVRTRNRIKKDTSSNKNVGELLRTMRK